MISYLISNFPPFFFNNFLFKFYGVNFVSLLFLKKIFFNQLKKIFILISQLKKIKIK